MTLRLLGNRPGFSAIVIIVLALGIGATSAIFSVVNAVMLRPLPYPQPDRLMVVFSAFERDGRSQKDNPVFGPDFVEWRAQCQACAQMAAYSGTWPGNPEASTTWPQKLRLDYVRVFKSKVAPALRAKGSVKGEVPPLKAWEFRK